jgi:hypothetical protein
LAASQAFATDTQGVFVVGFDIGVAFNDFVSDVADRAKGLRSRSGSIWFIHESLDSLHCTNNEMLDAFRYLFSAK